MTGQKIPSVHLSVAVTSIWQNKAKANPILVHLNGSVEVCKQSQHGAGPWGTEVGAVGGHGALPGNTAETLHSQWMGGSPWFLLGVPGDTQVCPRMLFRGRLIRGWGALKCPNACIYYVSVEQKVLKYMYSYNNRHCKHDVLFNWKWRG